MKQMKQIKQSTVINNRVFNKGILATAVVATMFGSGYAYATTTVIHNTFAASVNGTTNYSVSNNATLTITTTGSGMDNYYGTIDGHSLTSAENGTMGFTQGQRGNVSIVAENGLTLYGNVGATNGTGNFTLEANSSLYFADNMTKFRTTTLTIGQNSTVYTGNNASQGYNRKGSDSSNDLIITANITMRDSSVLNIGNGTTITGRVVGESDGQGTVNINGNVTTNGEYGSFAGSSNIGLATINVSAGNTLIAHHNMTATNIYVNGTIRSIGNSANMTASVLMGTSGKIYLDNNGLFGNTETAAKINGVINGNGARGGNLYVNGTWSTGGAIGEINGLDNIYLDYANN